MLKIALESEWVLTILLNLTFQLVLLLIPSFKMNCLHFFKPGFRHFTPKETVKRVARGITKQDQTSEEKDEASKSSKSVAKPFFNQLNGLTNNIKLANEPLWSLNEESYKVTDCTEYGALNFLEGAGYLVSPTENENVVTGKKRDFSDFDCQNTDQ